MEFFWDFEAWGIINLIAILLASLLLANALRRNFAFIRNTLIPTPVLGGIILLIISGIYEAITGDIFFNTNFFNTNGLKSLEIITYHALAGGFIASTLKQSTNTFTKKRSAEIFDSGVTTVSTYLLQGVLGMGITIFAAAFIAPEIFPASGLLLPFGYGQGSGQALNYGTIYESDYGFTGGSSFGLAIAALGFISASVGGVIHLNILKRRGKFTPRKNDDEAITSNEAVENSGEIPMNGSIDKLTVQIALIVAVYALTYFLMYGLGLLLPGMKATIYGFNFLFGVLVGAACKLGMNFLRKKNIIKKQYTNNFLLTHISNFLFDIMIVAGIAAIRIEEIKDYWLILLILGVVGLVATYFYVRYISYKFFPEY